MVTTAIASSGRAGRRCRAGPTSQQAIGAAVRADAWAATPARSSSVSTVASSGGSSAEPCGEGGDPPVVAVGQGSVVGHARVQPTAGSGDGRGAGVPAGVEQPADPARPSWGGGSAGRAGPAGSTPTPPTRAPRCASTWRARPSWVRASGRACSSGWGPRCGRWPLTSARRPATAQLARRRLADRLAAGPARRRTPHGHPPEQGQRPAPARRQAPPVDPQGRPPPARTDAARTRGSRQEPATREFGEVTGGWRRRGEGGGGERVELVARAGRRPRTATSSPTSPWRNTPMSMRERPGADGHAVAGDVRVGAGQRRRRRPGAAGS